MKQILFISSSEFTVICTQKFKICLKFELKYISELWVCGAGEGYTLGQFAALHCFLRRYATISYRKVFFDKV